MKIGTKAMSSPSRTEKFPPPLMRFLRSNTGSRSRGRSRSSPMFIRKKNAVIETQEPSSPKVTCMGQVRVRRSSKKSVSKSGSQTRRRPARRPCSCWWVRKTMSCGPFRKRRLKPKSCLPFLNKCLWFSPFGCCRRPKNSEAESSSLETETIQDANKTEHEENSEEEDESGAELKLEAFPSCSSLPKNALLLTRCRSAPYRSSSLASRFWGSPLVSTSSETGDDDENGESKSMQLQPLQDSLLETRPTSGNEPPSCKDSTLEPQSEGRASGGEMEGSINGGCLQEEEELGTGERGICRRALILTRCKSAPARRGERLYRPETIFWGERRLPLHVCD